MNLLKHTKTFLFFASILFVAQQSFGQDESRKGIYVSPMFSIGIGGATDENFIGSIGDGLDNAEDAGISYAIGANAGYMFNDHMGVMTGFVIRNYAGDPLDEGSGMRKDLEIPFFFRYITSKANNGGFFINAGFTPAFMIANNDDAQSSYYNYYAYNNNSSGMVQNTVNLSLALNFGYNMPMGKLGSLDIGPELCAGLLNTGTYSSYHYYPSTGATYSAYDLKTGYFGIRAQFHIHLTK